MAPVCHCSAGSHCGVLWLGGRVTTNFGVVDVVPLLGAIVGCHCSVLWLRGGWGPTLGEWTWCHCWVPLQGAIWTWCHCRVPLQCAMDEGDDQL